MAKNLIILFGVLTLLFIVIWTTLLLAPLPSSDKREKAIETAMGISRWCYIISAAMFALLTAVNICPP